MTTMQTSSNTLENAIGESARTCTQETISDHNSSTASWPPLLLQLMTRNMDIGSLCASRLVCRTWRETLDATGFKRALIMIRALEAKSDSGIALLRSELESFHEDPLTVRGPDVRSSFFGLLSLGDRADVRKNLTERKPSAPWSWILGGRRRKTCKGLRPNGALRPHPNHDGCHLDGVRRFEHVPPELSLLHYCAAHAPYKATAELLDRHNELMKQGRAGYADTSKVLGSAWACALILAHSVRSFELLQKLAVHHPYVLAPRSRASVADTEGLAAICGLWDCGEERPHPWKRRWDPRRPQGDWDSLFEQDSLLEVAMHAGNLPIVLGLLGQSERLPIAMRSIESCSSLPAIVTSAELADDRELADDDEGFPPPRGIAECNMLKGWLREHGRNLEEAGIDTLRCFSATIDYVNPRKAHFGTELVECMAETLSMSAAKHIREKQIERLERRSIRAWIDSAAPRPPLPIGAGEWWALFAHVPSEGTLHAAPLFVDLIKACRHQWPDLMMSPEQFTLDSYTKRTRCNFSQLLMHWTKRTLGVHRWVRKMAEDTAVYLCRRYPLLAKLQGMLWALILAPWAIEVGRNVQLGISTAARYGTAARFQMELAAYRTLFESAPTLRTALDDPELASSPETAFLKERLRVFEKEIASCPHAGDVLVDALSNSNLPVLRCWLQECSRHSLLNRDCDIARLYDECLRHQTEIHVADNSRNRGWDSKERSFGPHSLKHRVLTGSTGAPWAPDNIPGHSLWSTHSTTGRAIGRTWKPRGNALSAARSDIQFTRHFKSRIELVLEALCRAAQTPPPTQRTHWCSPAAPAAKLAQT